MNDVEEIDSFLNTYEYRSDLIVVHLSFASSMRFIRFLIFDYSRVIIWNEWKFYYYYLLLHYCVSYFSNIQVSMKWNELEKKLFPKGLER